MTAVDERVHVDPVQDVAHERACAALSNTDPPIPCPRPARVRLLLTCLACQRVTDRWLCFDDAAAAESDRMVCFCGGAVNIVAVDA